jgi:hypothetical protein
MGVAENFDEQESTAIQWKETKRGKGRVSKRSSGKQSATIQNVPKLTAVSHT